MKELKVFVLDTRDEEIDFEYNSSTIDIWSGMEILPPDAKLFISFCQSRNSEYTVREFMNAFNYEEITTFSYCIFITDKY